MQVIAKRKMQFIRAAVAENPITKEKVQNVLETFTLQFLPTEIQSAPDWIKEDGLFELAVADGDLIVVGGPAVGTAAADTGAETSEGGQNAK